MTFPSILQKKKKQQAKKKKKDQYVLVTEYIHFILKVNKWPKMVKGPETL